MDDQTPDRPPLSTLEAPELPLLQYVFLGPDGLRAGWGILLFAAIFELLLTAGVFATYYLHVSPEFRLTVQESIGCFAALAANIVMALGERRKLTAYGFDLSRAFPRFASGVVVGFTALSLFLALFAVLKHYEPGTIAVHGVAIAEYAALWAFFFLTVAIYEETLFRGYALATLTRGVGFWPAALLLSALFGYTHKGNSGESWFGLVSAGLFGLVLCFAIRRTGSLWWAIGFHTMWDYSQSFIYSTPDSGIFIPGHLLNSQFHGPTWLTGGSVGPEGSYLIVPLLAGIAAAIHWLYPAKNPGNKPL